MTSSIIVVGLSAAQIVDGVIHNCSPQIQIIYPTIEIIKWSNFFFELNFWVNKFSTKQIARLFFEVVAVAQAHRQSQSCAKSVSHISQL